MEQITPVQINKPLLRAAGRCDAREIKRLLDEGENPNMFGFSGHTPMHRVAGASLNGANDSDRLACFALLKQAGANPEARTENGATPLHAAAWQQSGISIMALHDMGVDLYAKDKEGRTAMDCCFEYQNEKGILALGSLGVPMRGNLFNKLTMRQAAVIGGQTSRLSILLDRFPPQGPDDELDPLCALAQEHGMQEAQALLQARVAQRMLARIQNKSGLDLTADWSMWDQDALNSAARAFARDRMQELAPVEYKSRDKLIEMKIDDFLALCKAGCHEGKLRDARSVLRQGESLREMPYLHVAQSAHSPHELVVDGHEGRHRARALAEMGFKTMPVLLRAAHIRWSEQNDLQRWDYKPHWPKSIRAEAGAESEHFTIAMPVSRNQVGKSYELDRFWPAADIGPSNQLKKGVQP